MVRNDPPAGTTERWIARPSAPLRGRCAAPGDKSMSHRALILGAMSDGATEIIGLLDGEDVRRTAACVATLGATVEQKADGAWRVVGRGRLDEPGAVLDCGNAGTGARLLMGATAGYAITGVFTGDDSLRSRPMRRVLEPLGRMGARWLCRGDGRLPLALRGGDLQAIDYRPPQASAQVKSAVLLAGVNACGRTTVTELTPTRDHTERMLRAFGVEVDVSASEAGVVIGVEGGQRLGGARIDIPGDPSSAAFPLVAALVTTGSVVTITGVLLNPARLGLIETLGDMGADIVIGGRRWAGGEEVGDITASFGALRGVATPAGRAASMIDEIPILAVAAAFAAGPTVIRGVGELRVKESDRIAGIIGLLAAAGVGAGIDGDDLTVAGAGRTAAGVAGGGRVGSNGDHRIAMSALVLGLAAEAPVEVDGCEMIATSFPDFAASLRRLGADIGPAAAAAALAHAG